MTIDLLVLAGVTCASAGVVARAFVRARRQARWSEYAQHLKGPCQVVSPPGRPLRVRLRTHDLGHGCLALAREREGAWWTRFADLAELHLDDEVFAERFHLRTDAPARARLWLDRDVRRALRVVYGWRLAVSDGALELEADDATPPLAQVLAARDALEIFAQVENRWRQRWSDVAPFLDARRVSHDPPHLESTHDGVIVAIEPRIDGNEAFVRVSVARPDAAPTEVRVPGSEPDRDALARAVADVTTHLDRGAERPYR
jgi:hypothetical protein